MKAKIFLISITVIVGLAFIACKKDNNSSTSTGGSGSNPTPGNYSIGDCGTFFDNGDYSAICISGGNNLLDDSLIYEQSVGGVKTCNYIIFESRPDEAIEVILSEYQSSTNASIFFQQAKSLYSPNTNHNDIGDDAFISTNDTNMNFDKLLVVQYGNTLIHMGLDSTSCALSNVEMKNIAQKIIDNL